jgi:hypothetical protein
MLKKKTYSPGIMMAAKPKSFLKLANPRMKGKNKSSFNLNNFKMINKGINIFFSRSLPSKILKKMEN